MPLIVTPGTLVQRAELYHQLSSLLTAGVGVLQALEMIRRSPPSFRYRRPLAAVQDRLAQGATLTESLLSQGAWLPPFDLALIQAGEQSGRLPDCFRQLANYYQERAQLARQVIGDLLYPLFIVHFAVAVFPTSHIVDLFKTGNPVPFLMAKLTVLLPAYAVVFLLLAAAQAKASATWRAVLEQFVRLIPVAGSARRLLSLARLATALEALISAGVPVIEGWRMAAAASGSPALIRQVNSWKDRLQSGQTPGEILADRSGFPELFANLYHTGEISGQLDDTLRRLHQHYLEEGTRKLRLLARWVPILIYVAILLAVATQIIGFWTGYYNDITNIGEE